MSMTLRRGLISADRYRSHEEVEANTMRAAAGLMALGVEPGDAIAILMRNDFAFFEASYAAQAAGVYAVPVNWHLAPAEVAHILEDSEAKVLVVHADLLRHMAERIPESVTVLTVPTPPEVVDAYGIDPSDAEPMPTCRLWSDWLAGFEPLAEVHPLPTETMMYTSGTTGLPKGVKRGRQSAEANASMAVLRDKLYGIESGIRALVAGPLYHAAPNSMALRAGRVADAVIILPSFDAEEFLSAIEREKITTTFMVPTMFVRLLKLPDDIRLRYKISSLGYIMHAAAPCPSDIKRRMINWVGPIVHEFYGGTEGGYWTVSTSEDWLKKPGTVGRPPPEVTLRALDESGNEVPVGEPGVLYGKHDFFPDFTYHKREKARQEVGHGDLITIGDIGYFDEDGFVFICDRAKDMVVSGGANIYPAEIEAVLVDMPGVADGAVFGIPDPEFGERLMAVVQTQPDADISEDGVMDYLRRHLAGFKVPRVIEFRDDLPRGDDGKIYKRRLREPYWQGHERQV
ncbi:MAG: AMP-binding protein [Rhodospirillaceae bacterium]|nr:AMP-binding protein [Rhodospirillaceae bacterium]